MPKKFGSGTSLLALLGVASTPFGPDRDRPTEETNMAARSTRTTTRTVTPKDAAAASAAINGAPRRRGAKAASNGQPEAPVKTEPKAELTAESTENTESKAVAYSFVLVNGDFSVHTPTCRSLKTDLANSDYERPGTDEVPDGTERGIIVQLWEDILGDHGVTPEDVTDAQIAEYGLPGATNFHKCIAPRLTTGYAKPEPAPKVGKAEAKRMIAQAVIKAAAAFTDMLADDNMADPASPEVAAINANFTVDEVRTLMSQWLHYLPAGGVWPECSLPVPDRSDWRK